MSSVPNTEYRNQTRIDGGPFLALEPVDETGAPATGEESPAWIDVYYSDAPVPVGTPLGADPWIRIMKVEADSLTIWPVHQRFDDPDYGQPIFHSIRELIIPRPFIEFEDYPETQEALEEILDGLPTGFYRDWRYGLGVKWEYRSILTTIENIPGVDTVYFSATTGTPDEDYIEHSFYILRMSTFQTLRKRLAAVGSRHQRAARREKWVTCHNILLNGADPESFPKQRLALPEGALAEIAAACDSVKLTKGDQRAVVQMVQEHAETLAQDEPAELFRLKESIERVTLSRLIERCTELLQPSTTETKWQKLLSENPFILSLAFHYPVIRVGDVPYVGGKSHVGAGGSYSDFLMAAVATNNLALVELKGPGTSLVGKPYRGIYPPSTDLSGAVAQVVAQRAELQLNFMSSVGRQLDRQGYRPHSIACVVIAGLKPTNEEQSLGFEQYRHTLQGVHVVTFDELIDKLKALHNLLAGGQPTSTTVSDERPLQVDNPAPEIYRSCPYV